MNKNILMIALFTMLSTILCGQELTHIGERVIVGTSYTLIRDNEINDWVYKENTWNKNIATNITKNIYIGIQHLGIQTKGSSFSNANTEARYDLVGLFSQYDFLPKKKNRLFIEFSINYGDYCTCDNLDPYREDNIKYFGIGGGFDFPLYKFISIDLSFIGYRILNDFDSKYTYTQYVVGLNFDFVTGGK